MWLMRPEKSISANSPGFFHSPAGAKPSAASFACCSAVADISSISAGKPCARSDVLCVVSVTSFSPERAITCIFGASASVLPSKTVSAVPGVKPVGVMTGAGAARISSLTLMEIGSTVVESSKDMRMSASPTAPSFTSTVTLYRVRAAALSMPSTSNVPDSPFGLVTLRSMDMLPGRT